MKRDAKDLWILVPEQPTQIVDELIREQGLQHAARGVTRELITNVHETWATVIEQLGTMLQSSTSGVSGFHVDSVTVKLGIDGKGSIGVITAGLTAAFEVTFERNVSEV